MQAIEKRAIFSLGAIMAFRMLGLFMILPVFSTYATQFRYATPLLIGLAIGIYGLTQAVLQIPFGSLSDRIGRKPIIATGLVLFAVGSIVAALSHSIYGIILGRAIQGAGAIGSTTLAMVADLTRDENRTKAMAGVGLTIGLAFSVAMALGPLINHWFHLQGIFYFTAFLALAGIVLLFTTVPNPKRIPIQHTESIGIKFKRVLKNKALLQLDFGIFASHAILTATFLGIPILLTHFLQLSQIHQIFFYLLILFLSFMLMIPWIIIAEKKRRMKQILLGAIAILGVSQLIFLKSHQSLMSVGITLVLFFTAFTLLEASLPSLVSKIAPIRSKGTAMGVYSASQFFGIFIGGSLGGWLLGRYQLHGIYIFCLLLVVLWLLIAARMKQPPYLSTLLFPIPAHYLDKHTQLNQYLAKIPGIAEAVILDNEHLIHLKVDKKIIDIEKLRKSLEAGSLHSE